jgi:hypothetical protein
MASDSACCILVCKIHDELVPASRRSPQILLNKDLDRWDIASIFMSRDLHHHQRIDPTLADDGRGRIPKM